MLLVPRFNQGRERPKQKLIGKTMVHESQQFHTKKVLKFETEFSNPFAYSLQLCQGPFADRSPSYNGKGIDLAPLPKRLAPLSTRVFYRVGGFCFEFLGICESTLCKIAQFVCGLRCRSVQSNQKLNCQWSKLVGTRGQSRHASNGATRSSYLNNVSPSRTQPVCHADVFCDDVCSFSGARAWRDRVGKK